MNKKHILYCFAILVLILIFSISFCFKEFLSNDKNEQQMENPKISIIIPCYNCERFLENVFSMIDNQTFSDYEVIFINDGSTDRTKKLITEYSKKNKRAKLISYIKNKKAGHARNLGLKKAKGDYVIFLDTDDIYLPSLLKSTYDIAIKTNVDIVFFKTGYLDDRTKEIQLKDNCFHEPNYG